IDVEEAGLLLIEGIAVADTDPMIVLFDDVGREIQRNDDNAGSLDSLVAARVFPGQYAFAVMQPGGSGKTGTIRVVIERYVPAD
ncbi:MAG: ABC transporter substrate-binding protein, partial [Paracoccaceae bacterium]|nr:ABC transporter substrate-binding protein [Paracoccaceae bacterium]